MIFFVASKAKQLYFKDHAFSSSSHTASSPSVIILQMGGSVGGSKLRSFFAGGGELQKYIKNDHNSLIFWQICIKFGMWVHSMGMNTHVNFEDLESRIFGLSL